MPGETFAAPTRSTASRQVKLTQVCGARLLSAASRKCARAGRDLAADAVAGQAPAVGGQELGRAEAGRLRAQPAPQHGELPDMASASCRARARSARAVRAVGACNVTSSVVSLRHSRAGRAPGCPSGGRPAPRLGQDPQRTVSCTLRRALSSSRHSPMHQGVKAGRHT